MNICKRKAISLETKKNIIEESEGGVKNSELCQKFNIDKRSISKILKNKEVILNAIGKGGSIKRVRITGGKNKELDEALIGWVRLQQADNIPINGPILKEKALEMSKILMGESSTFAASDGWLSRFKERHAITFNKIIKVEEGEAVDMQQFEDSGLEGIFQNNNPILTPKRQKISIELKKKIIDYYLANPKTSLKQIAEEFSNFNVLLKKSSIHSILKNKQNIIAAIDNGIKIKRSHLTKGRHANFDDALLNWIRQVRAENVVITGTLLKEKAMEMASLMGIDNFKASNGWMEKFKERHSIRFRTEKSETEEPIIDIIQNVTNWEVFQNALNLDTCESPVEEIEDFEIVMPISTDLARQSYLCLRKYWQENGLDESLYSSFDKIEDILFKEELDNNLNEE
uniref:HTH CENPB-type domain-containing protein n=1 Tax=Meloidogyne floridensis TaxID=298350 RepID=A0A915P2Z6_9BILA